MSKRKSLIIGSLVLIFVGVVFLLTNQLVLAQALQSPDAKNTEKPTMLADMNSDNFSLQWNVVGQGGGITTSTNFKVHSTIGQPAVGNTTSTSFKLHTGFWQKFILKVFLPLLTR